VTIVTASESLSLIREAAPGKWSTYVRNPTNERDIEFWKVLSISSCSRMSFGDARRHGAGKVTQGGAPCGEEMLSFLALGPPKITAAVEPTD
jgi:hypothetical protein